MGDADGSVTATRATSWVVGGAGVHRSVGFVRNVVTSAGPDYPWPVPVAHFRVVEAVGEPVVAGVWVGTGAGSVLRERHWFALLEG